MIRTIRARIILWTLLTVTAALAAFGGISHTFLHNHLYRGVDEALTGEAEEVTAQLVVRDGVPVVRIEAEWEEHEHTEFGSRAIYLALRDGDGRVLRRSRNLERLPMSVDLPELPERSTPAFSVREVPGHRFRQLDYPVMADDGRPAGWITALFLLDEVDAYLTATRTTFFVLLPLALAVVALGLLAITRRTLAPIQRIQATAREIMNSGNLEHRITSRDSDAEIQALIDILNQLFERMESSFERLRHFAADASHELRTPLTVLRGQIEVALSRPDRPPADYRRTLESILDEVIHLSGIIGNLLLISRIDADHARPRMGLVRLNTLVREKSAQLTHLAARHGISLKVEGNSELEVLGDREHLGEVVINLVDNAIKYNRSGGSVWIRLFRDDNEAVLEVSDDGIGIPDADQPRIFDRFYRVDKSRSRQSGGTGLGLAIVRWMVDAHDGRIAVESRPGGGTTMRVTLPMVEYE